MSEVMRGFGYARPTLMQQIVFGCRSNYFIFRVSGNLRMVGIAAGIALSQAVAAADNVYVNNNGIGPFDPAFSSVARDVADYRSVAPLSPAVSPVPRRLQSSSQCSLTSAGPQSNNENRKSPATLKSPQILPHVSSELDQDFDRMDRKIAELIKEGQAQWAAIEMAAPERAEPDFPSSSHVRPAQLYDLGERASMMAEAAGLVKEALSNWEEASQQSETIRQQSAAETHMKNVYAHLFERAKARMAAASPVPTEDGSVVNTSSHAGLPEIGHSDSDQHSELVRYPDSDRPAPSESTSDNEPTHYALRRELLHSLVTELSTAPLRLPPGISIDDARVSVGAPGSERRIVNVARGTHSTDAVNKAQLDEAVARVDGDASAGIASAMAVAGLPQPTSAGRSIATASSASYRGRPGMAFGVSHVTSDDRWVIKLAASANGRGYFGAVAAGGFQW